MINWTQEVVNFAGQLVGLCLGGGIVYLLFVRNRPLSAPERAGIRMRLARPFTNPLLLFSCTFLLTSVVRDFGPFEQSSSPISKYFSSLAFTILFELYIRMRARSVDSRS